ncbi:MAG: GntR family transcriptional regulator [Acidimicrobiales bacterium]
MDIGPAQPDNRPEAVLDAHQLDRESPIPLWFQIVELLGETIESGQLRPGDRLENEFGLSERLGVSRPTVRQAMQALVQKNLVVRRRGVGTIVASRPVHRPVALTSLYDDLHASGRKPSTRVLSLEEDIAGSEVAAELGIEPDEPVLRMERIRFADDLALALMSNVVPAKILKVPLTATELEATGLYAALRAQGVRLRTAHQTIGARNATAREARLLATGRNATMLAMVRVANSANGAAIELGRHTYPASRYSFEIDLFLK